MSFRTKTRIIVGESFDCGRRFEIDGFKGDSFAVVTLAIEDLTSVGTLLKIEELRKIITVCETAISQIINP